jgi:hypothetical protein
MAYPKSTKGQDPPQKGNYRSNQAGAGNGIRTRDTKLGKLVLYQLSYARLKNNNIMKTGDNVNLNFFRGYLVKDNGDDRPRVFGWSESCLVTIYIYF